MKVIFIIQGEGRGHMTQAIALNSILHELNHEVVAVCIGKSSRRKIPDFFARKIECPIHTFESPNFVTDKNHKKILIGKTISQNIFQSKTYYKSLKKLNRIVKDYSPDLIINFYDLLAGIFNLVFKPNCKFWAIGHQYMIYHPNFQFAPSKNLEKILFILNTKLTALSADLHLALSFVDDKADLKSKKTIIIPPLLRPELFKLKPTKGDFILTYMVNAGYGEEVYRFASNNPEIRIEAFWDNAKAEKLEKPLPNLTFHQIDDRLFLNRMAECKGLISTAGFESICEAMYLTKPVMMVPVAGQYEQACNALDATSAGAGFSHHEFDFEKFDKFLVNHMHSATPMKPWANSIKDHITEAFMTYMKDQN
ncbi:glycosyltransferase family protein [Belliella kenyensis]|uniref:Glycosyltransferase family protein n=1 Tax=Belliella kenyensis TaxID=1472724 RepID=A0ABV8ENK5_9BACT|nr:glycosyltransferase family protein [Belliella kenyensis]MCH7403654.1 glycosyltransferase [Belliella kenyensis]MDN3602192.1 glycosyltransferase family protein [Belliella kenyensis]